ncbi:hypothetical protein PoB_001183400 [Plakobranchus ocellatus]|uniref:Uncharacterized protein n=1 Tax=Plakobranchus ocellatus TaxID=259542 RepID=A0AAV3YTT0_9GAST|nr:hypothetical protein PoB_001183400 [Plakobranchus ocellatus]
MTRTGNLEELERESFWKEHQDTLVRIRNDLSSGKKSRSKFSPAAGIRKRTPNGVSGTKSSNHPPLGKYRRTPSPYHLPKLSPHADGGKHSPYQNGLARTNKYEIVPPVKPKLAFSKQQPVDYDSWGEEEDEDDEDDVEVDRQNPAEYTKGNFGKGGNSKRGYKPQPYPSPVQTYSHVPQVVYGAPFPVYYPPPPRGSKGAKKLQARKQEKSRGYRDIHTARKAARLGQSGIPISKRRKGGQSQNRRSMPMFATPFPMMPLPMMYQPMLEEEDEEDEEEDEMAKLAFLHWRKHPLFAEDFTDWFINDCLDTELVPDFLIGILREMKHMPYDHPLYLPSLYSCEDLLSDHIAELTTDIVREAVAEAANDYMDEKMLQHDPLEDFLNDLIEDAVRLGVRETVRSAVVHMAEDYVEEEYAMSIIHDLLDDHLDEIGEELLEDTLFDIMADDFIEREVITSEVKEESEAIAREVIQHYDSKVMKREFREVSQKATHKLADTILMSYMMSVVAQQGKIWTEDDHYNRQLDDMIFNTSMMQMFNVRRQKEKTLGCKPLQKLHERAVSDVALDVFLQHLTRSLDEDLADVDEWERGVTDGKAHPFPLAAISFQQHHQQHHSMITVHTNSITTSATPSPSPTQKKPSPTASPHQEQHQLPHEQHYHISSTTTKSIITPALATTSSITTSAAPPLKIKASSHQH